MFWIPNFRISRSPDFQNLAWAGPGLGLGPGFEMQTSEKEIGEVVWLLSQAYASELLMVSASMALASLIAGRVSLALQAEGELSKTAA